MEILQPSWRGRLLSTRKDSSGKYTAMTGGKALLFVPVNVLPGSVYRVSLELRRESGNGVAYCNIYGNRNFDFPHIKIECSGNNWNTFDVDLETKSFPETLPLVFRIWREPGGTGSLLVRRIKVDIISKEAKQDKPKLISTEPPVHKPSPFAPTKSSEPATPPPEPLKKRKVPRRPGRRGRNRSLVLMPSTPRVLPEIVGVDGIKVSVIMSSFNRLDFLKRTLLSYANQSLPKEEFEIIIVDDQSTQDIEGLCREYAEEHKLKFQFILFDRNKGAIPAITWTPALSNNIGLKYSRGSVIVITGPESLQKEDNLKYSWESANTGYGIYGNIYRSNTNFVDEIIKDDKWKTMSVSHMLSMSGAKADTSVTRGGWWWYYVAIRKEHMMAINGVDERFMKGISGEDDNFANRLMAYGLPLKRDHRIEGIHQDHSREDRAETTHSWRFDKKEWRRLRRNNDQLLNEWMKNREAVANTNIDWGSDAAIIKKEVF